jgi:hypothetical protein
MDLHFPWACFLQVVGNKSTCIPRDSGGTERTGQLKFSLDKQPESMKDLCFLSDEKQQIQEIRAALRGLKRTGILTCTRGNDTKHTPFVWLHLVSNHP